MISLSNDPETASRSSQGSEVQSLVLMQSMTYPNEYAGTASSGSANLTPQILFPISSDIFRASITSSSQSTAYS